jgi:RTX calcium-binding nonapeptide repeat (4 copies)
VQRVRRDRRTHTFFGGLRQAPTGPVSYLGGDGLADALRHTEADRGVVVTLGQGAADGRPGDLEDARGDIEVLEGSRFGDRLTATDDELGELLLGGGGVDAVDARGGPDRIDEGLARNGGDVIDGGAGRDIVDYSRRTTDTDVRLDDVADDGERGAASEGDNVKSTVEDVITGRGRDQVTGSRESNDIRTGAGRDIVHGSGLKLGQIELGGDTINPGAGPDSVIGSDANDVIHTRDGENDDIGCKLGLDFVTTDVLDLDRNNGTFDGSDHVNSCEAVDAPGAEL